MTMTGSDGGRWLAFSCSSFPRLDTIASERMSPQAPSLVCVSGPRTGSPRPDGCEDLTSPQERDEFNGGSAASRYRCARVAGQVRWRRLEPSFPLELFQSYLSWRLVTPARSELALGLARCVLARSVHQRVSELLAAAVADVSVLLIGLDS